MTEPISIMLPFDSRPKTVTISAELSYAYVALLRIAESITNNDDTDLEELDKAVKSVLRAGGGK